MTTNENPFEKVLALCRLASGSSRNLVTDREMLRAQLGLIGPDRLPYSLKDMMGELGGRRDHSEV